MLALYTSVFGDGVQPASIRMAAVNVLEADLKKASPESLEDLKVACPAFDVRRPGMNGDVEFYSDGFSGHNVTITATVNYSIHKKGVVGFLSLRDIRIEAV